jgi:hypothetical protein
MPLPVFGEGHVLVSHARPRRTACGHGTHRTCPIVSRATDPYAIAAALGGTGGKYSHRWLTRSLWPKYISPYRPVAALAK